MAYFDNAATTFPKPECVYSFMDEFYRQSGGSFGRGDHVLAQSTGSLIFDTRERLKALLHCPAKVVVFEPTATVSLNIIIQGMVNKGAKNIYITPFEHNAVTRVLHHYEKIGTIRVQQLEVNADFSYDLERIRYQFQGVKPDLVIASHASNVIGLVAPIAEIFALAKAFDATTLVDMAQTAGLVDLDVGSENIDFAVFAGHKTLMGPTGISGFLMKPDFDLPPVLFGGTGFESANQDMPSNLPERFEAGTMNTLGVAGLNAALKWIEDQTIDCIFTTEMKHRDRLISLFESYDYLKIVGNVPGRKYVGIVSCVLDGISSDSAARIFDSRNISVRTGLHCAPLAHKLLGTFPSGTVRFSLNCLTTDADFDQLATALDGIGSEL